MKNYTSPQNPQSPTPLLDDLWNIQYNIGKKILPIKRDLYSNSQPHRPKPNSLLDQNPLSLHKNLYSFRNH